MSVRKCGDVLELEDEEDDDERVGASGFGLGGLLLVGGLIATGAWLVKKVTEPRGIPVSDPTGQSPASMFAAFPPSVASAGYHFETTAAGDSPRPRRLHARVGPRHAAPVLRGSLACLARPHASSPARGPPRRMQRPEEARVVGTTVLPLMKHAPA